MSKLPTSLVTSAHAYTKADAPWIIREPTAANDRLAHYISGGGMMSFGRTVGQELTRRRHRRFLLVSAALSAVWLVFYFI